MGNISFIYKLFSSWIPKKGPHKDKDFRYCHLCVAFLATHTSTHAHAHTHTQTDSGEQIQRDRFCVMRKREGDTGDTKTKGASERQKGRRMRSDTSFQRPMSG